MSKRGGRKRRAGNREPNGRAQRSDSATTERDVMRQVTAYRQRVFGISAADLKDQKGATLIGRLCLQGTISSDQWQAGEDWLSLVNARYAASNAPRGFKSSGNAALAIDEEAEVRRYASIKARFDAANTAVEERAPVLECKARFEALSCIIVQEIDNTRMYGALRLALNALVRFFATEARAA